MIPLNSKSYPYLAIALHYNVPYAEVLQYSDYYNCDDYPLVTNDWETAVWRLERDKNNLK